MRAEGRAAVLTVVVTSVCLVALLVADPLGRASRALAAAADAGRSDALVRNLYVNPLTQDASNGRHPLASLRTLSSAWCAAQDQRRFVLMGNSQTLTVLLSPAEQSGREAERTYPDLLLERLQQAGSHVKGYRLSAPNLSYTEALWYLHYLLADPCLRPTDVVLQMNFESFRKTGVRDGMQELLDNGAFSAAAAAEARSSAPYAAAFQQAVDHHQATIAGEGQSPAGDAQSRTGVLGAQGWGGQLETILRNRLDASTTFRSRAAMKVAAMDLLYRGRVHFLGISPSSKRSIGPATLQLSVSALERIGELCKEHGIRLTLFNAPQNPQSPLYRTDEDRRQYREVIQDLASRYAFRYFDFENSIPGEMWGVFVDGPDPIHFGRAAHRRLADLMFSAGMMAPAN